MGGAVIGLYASDEGSEPPRPTIDINISVQISTYSQMNHFREKLATKQIYPASSEKVLYRYSYENILIDFIPFEDTSLGPTNRWFKYEFNKVLPITIGNIEIKILQVSIFLASKWEAYKDRGKDPRTSPDFEDIIYVIDNNKNLISDITQTHKDVQTFLKEMGHKILAHPSRNEIIECHLNPLTAEERREALVEKLKQIIDIA